MTVYGSQHHNPTFPYEIKEDMKAALDRYSELGVPTGDFLRALLSNDLMEAHGRADDQNRRDIDQLCMYVYNEMPSLCHGSYDLVDAWLTMHKEKKDTDAKLKEERDKLREEGKL